MLRNENYNRIMVILIGIVLILSIALILIGRRTITFHQLSIKGLAVMNSWHGMERIKNDFLVNRSNITVGGDFDYKSNVTAWKEHTEGFQLLFSDLINEMEKVFLLKEIPTHISESMIVWNSTHEGIKRVQSTLEQLERVGLDRLVLPQLIHNYYVFRDTVHVDFEDTVLLIFYSGNLQTLTQ